jgi:hypothetical protein
MRLTAQLRPSSTPSGAISVVVLAHAIVGSRGRASTPTSHALPDAEPRCCVVRAGAVVAPFSGRRAVTPPLPFQVDLVVASTKLPPFPGVAPLLPQRRRLPLSLPGAVFGLQYQQARGPVHRGLVPASGQNHLAGNRMPPPQRRPPAQEAATPQLICSRPPTATPRAPKPPSARAAGRRRLPAAVDAGRRPRRRGACLAAQQPPARLPVLAGRNGHAPEPLFPGPAAHSQFQPSGSFQFKIPFSIPIPIQIAVVFQNCINSNICPKFMKLVQLCFEIHILSIKNIKLNSST